jgi:uncharacterized protein YndB with AHSA1/START domain
MTDTFDVIGTRDIPARLDAAWKSWTDPEYVLHWWGPKGFTCTVAEMDVRVGGRSHVVHEFEPVRRIIDAAGIPRDVRHVITFDAIAPDVTRLTVRESSYPTAEARDLSRQALEECLDKLVAVYV